MGFEQTQSRRWVGTFCFWPKTDMRDQDHRAGKVVDGLDQRRATVDVEMVGRLVEDHEMRRAEGGKPEQQPRLLAARQLLHLGITGQPGKTDGPDARAHFRFRRIRHQPAHMAFGLLSNTAFLAIGLPPAHASALIHTAEIFTTSASAASHIYHRNVDWRLVARLGIAGVLGAILGAWILSNVDVSAARRFVYIYLLVMRPPANGGLFNSRKFL